MKTKDKIGTETIASVRDGKELSDYEYRDLLMRYYKEVGIGLTESGKGADDLRQHHRRVFVRMLDEKGVKVNFFKA
jgi:hypothetical protein